MKLKQETYDRVAVISIAGEANVDEIEPLRRMLAERIDQDTRDFVLDMGEAEFLDSKALELLLWLQEQADERLGQVRLASCNETIQRILQITRLEHHFDAHADVETALKSLR